MNVFKFFFSNLLENLQTSRVQNKFLKFNKIPVFHEPTQQKLALKKFISSEENLQVNIFFNFV